MSFLDLNSRVAVVIGGVQGIGLAISRRLAIAVSTVAIADISLSGAQGFISGLTENNAAAPFACDVSDANSVQGMMGAILKAYAQIDILANNAGIFGKTAPIQDQTDDDWHQMTPLSAPVQCST